jgi:hypothetical protein
MREGQGHSPEPGSEGQGLNIAARPSYDEILEENRRLKATREQVGGGGGGQQAAAAAPTPTVYTRNQINTFVMEGRISEEQGQAILDQQQADLARTAGEQAAQRYVSDAMRGQRTLGEIDRYKRSIPGLKNSSSDSYAKVARAYRDLVSDGQPDNDYATELLALRIAFGDIVLIEKTDSGEGRRETNPEGDSGNSPPGDGDTAPPDKAASDMPRDQARYYKDLLDKGIYRDWSQINKEWAKRGKYAGRGGSVNRGAA